MIYCIWWMLELHKAAWKDLEGQVGLLIHFCLDLQMLHVFAGYSLSFFCSPHMLDWDEDPEVDTVLEEGCGLDGKDADELGGDNEKCNQQAAATKKRAAWQHSGDSLVRLTQLIIYLVYLGLTYFAFFFQHLSASEWICLQSLRH